ncbi:YafY family transcriptional regulator [Ktedonosporobacter rubrisoli]|uniref:YafY family transcriptional regulator n=1 Tax=Ktedonosporobacter rubrisoli TaxID=2509675 RepID=A0A4P6JPF3_KTERU|nr:YafY family protein [Ktedonosporobacter rubrisoli]QBD77093.1 YafY family transcriptional regulator [Ktedonosporobacter rubrisoli]
MNRIDRLTAILLLLQTGKRSATEIAQHFEVSRRTIQRDIDALCEMGIPIIADLGAAGGYSLPPDFTLPPLALTLHEALLLRLALSGLSQLSATPFKQERESLLAKIKTLLPQGESEHLEQFTNTLSLGVPSLPYPAPFLDQLLQSAHERQWVCVTYRSEKGVSQQTILPTRLRSHGGLWYCDGFSHERQAWRIYRVDRFLDVKAAPSSPQPLESPIPIPTREHPSFPVVRIHLTARGVLRLEHDADLGPRLQRQDNGEGWLILHWRTREYDWLVRILLSLGTDAKILEPEELRRRVKLEAKKIACHHTEL